jgi:hypothetical protein
MAMIASSMRIAHHSTPRSDDRQSARRCHRVFIADDRWVAGRAGLGKLGTNLCTML